MREISINCKAISIHGKNFIQSIFRDITETNEQVRSLDCLYGISQLVEEPDIAIKEIITRTLNLIPLAWQFPKLTCARILYNEKEFCTENFKETKWKLSTNIKINKKLLELEVYNLDDRKSLKGEVNLINDIGKRLKVIIEQNEAKQKLKDSKQKLLESEQKFKALFNNINDPVLIHDHGGKFIEVNKTACEVLGYSKEELMNLNPKDIAPPRIIELLPEMIKNLYEKGYNAFESEFLTKDGRIIPVELNSRIFDYKEKQAIITVTRDITERKQSELKLKESEARYHEAFDRTTFYKDLLTHDLNNILQVIQLTLEISSLDENVSKDLKESLELIKSQVLRGSKLISNVQKLSQLEESQKSLQNMDIYNVLMDSLNFLKNSFKMKKINVKVDTPRKNYLVTANNILREVIENILINAVKYNENSAVEILIRFSEEQKERINYIKVEFLDNGRGIPDSLKKIIFHKGFLEEKQSKGMGIGLTLVKKAIETYNGQIWIEDKITGDYSKGSNFIIMIPEAG